MCPDEQCEDRKQQVGAELCQAQVKLEVSDEDEVKVRSEVKVGARLLDRLGGWSD